MTEQPSYPLSAEVRAFLSDEPLRMLVGSEWQLAASGRAFPVFDPSTGQVIAHVAEGDTMDIDRAVSAAEEAFPRWQKVSPAERARLIWRLSELIERDADHLAQLDTLNVGLPLSKTRFGEIPAIVDDFRYYAGWPTKIHGKTLPASSTSLTVYTVREPIGVCGAIIPWNFPLPGVSGKLGPALACGNVVVLKPAEESPLSALWLGRLFLEAGFPPGVVNIVPGFGETAGAALANHPGVRKVGFTGSTEVGRKIVQASAGNLKRVSLELGGKSPNVVLADADLDLAADRAVWAIFSHAGQNCIAGSRMYIEDAVYEEVVERVCQLTRKIRVGVAFDPETQVGPLISSRQLDRVLGYVRQGIQAGAVIRLGGGRPNGVPDSGFFLEPTVFVDASEDMAIVREEIFGPVLAILPFDSFDDLIERANNTEYGLAAAIWTRDLKRAHQFARVAQAGTVWINGYGLADAPAPFGGLKQSGFGRELGEASLDEYLQTKTVWVNHAA
jgi:acyl-CoA reductase-like NAD-dependent aldehyde dehydrogenase